MKALLVLLSTAALWLATSAPAFAAKTGEGLAGETNDKVITFFGFGLMIFFTLLICIGSLIQHKLDKRKDARKATQARQRVGW